jgi:outer membrane protein, heavy metal efflux system
MTSRGAAAAALVSIWIILGAKGAVADPPSDRELPEALTLDRALDLLRDRSPRSRAEHARIDVAAAERIAAGVYPNPSLSYGGLALAHGANTGAAWQHQIVLEQPLLLFGQRGAREDVADLGVRAESARVSASLADRALAVRQAFATLVARQERARVLEESVAELSRLEQIVRGRQKAGDRSVYDVARIELETTTLRVELSNAQTDVEDASGRLASLLGFPGWRPRAEGDLEPRQLPTSLDRLWGTAQSQRPSIAAARAQEATARGGLTLARRERLPVPAVALGTLLTQQEISASVFFGLSLPLPVFDRGQGAIARATAEMRAGERAVEAELAETRADLERARAVYLRQRETLRNIEQQMVDRIPALRRMAEESYRGGSAGILELLDSFRSVKEIRLTHLAQREAVKQAEASLIAVAGLEPLGPARGRRR